MMINYTYFVGIQHIPCPADELFGCWVILNAFLMMTDDIITIKGYCIYLDHYKAT